jgi:2-polyprenyl-6-methoxyphenol hydroxylase-like FAD-dependent oxidoreductase
LNTIKNTKTLIVGAGPSGLMMACQLALRNIPFRIIEKNEHHSNYSGALIIQPRTLEIFDQMGIAEKAMASGVCAHKINIIFNRVKSLTLELKDLGKDLSKFPNLLMLEQSKTEQLLINFIKDYGYAVERRTTLLRLCPDSDDVTVILKLPDGSEEIIKTPYLIAADGGQSLVRTQLNIPFLGKSHKLSLFVLDTKAEINLPSNTISFFFSKNASSGIFPLTSGMWRIDGTIPKELETKDILTFNDIEKNFAQRIGMDVKLYDPQWFSVFHSHQRYAGLFRQNRIFLIGDAAHVLSPVGAQGMNTGLQDAYNLAWKLAMVIEGQAKDSLLDSYHEERQHLAKKLVSSTDRAFQMVTSNSFLAKKFRLGIAPLLLRLLFSIIQKKTWIGRLLFK